MNHGARLVQAVNDENIDEVHNVMRIAMYSDNLSTRDYIAKLVVDDSKGYNILHYVAERGFVGFFVYLQNLAEMRNSREPCSGYVASLRAQDREGHTPLHIAVLNNRLDVVKAIYTFFEGFEIKIGKDGAVNVAIDPEDGPLDEDYQLPVKSFLSIKDNAGRTAMEEAQHANHTEITAWLKRYGGAQGVL